MRSTLRVSLLVVLLALGGCPSSDVTGLEILVTIPDAAIEAVQDLRVSFTAPNGFVAISPPISPATGVSVGTTAAGVLQITFSRAGRYDLTSNVRFQLALPNAAGQSFTVKAEGFVASGSDLIHSDERPANVLAGRMTDVVLETTCISQEGCVAQDGGMAGNPFADQAAHFSLLGGNVGTSNLKSFPLAQAMVCNLYDPAVADLVVAVPQAVGNFSGNTQWGRVLIYRGAQTTWSGKLDLQNPNVTIIGHANGEQLGEALACADFDGDGHQDLVIGAPNAEGGMGRVYVVYSAGTIAKGNVIQMPLPLDDGGVLLDGGLVAGVTVIQGPTAGAKMGAALATARLFESRPALVIGAPEAGGGEGLVYIVPRDVIAPGARVLLGGGESLVLAGTAGQRLGFALAAGPLGEKATSATRDDVAIGAPGATLSATAAGAVYLLPATAVASLPDGGTLDQGLLRAIFGPASSKFGEALAVGDLTQDGTLDLLVGAPQFPYDGRMTAGAVYLLEGGTLLQEALVDLTAASPPAPLRAIIGGPYGACAFGTSIAAVTSTTSTNADLWIGAPSYDNGRGLAVLLKGGTGLAHTIDTGAEGTALFKVLGVASGDRLGESVAAGSLGNDGNSKGDLVIVAPGAKDAPGTVGAVYGILDETPK
jgi:hypothetical protein